MHQKYIAATIALPRQAEKNLAKARKALAEVLGFEPSRSDTVAYLAKFYCDQMAETEFDPKELGRRIDAYEAQFQAATKPEENHAD